MFQYRFERLQNLKESEKKQTESQYQNEFQRLESIGTRLVQLLQEKESLMNQSEESLRDTTSIQAIRGLNGHISRLNTKIVELQSHYESQKGTVQHLKQTLIKHTTECKKFEKHRHTQEKQFKDYWKKAEMKKLDEVAAHQFLKG